MRSQANEKKGHQIISCLNLVSFRKLGFQELSVVLINKQVTTPKSFVFTCLTGGGSYYQTNPKYELTHSCTHKKSPENQSQTRYPAFSAVTVCSRSKQKKKNFLSQIGISGTKAHLYRPFLEAWISNGLQQLLTELMNTRYLLIHEPITPGREQGSRKWATPAAHFTENGEIIENATEVTVFWRLEWQD